jgi:anti-anti-sigma factor
MANVVSALCGDIDRSTVAAFRSDLYGLIDRCEQPIVHVDFAAVTFMDSAGYHALVEATEYGSRRGHVLVLRNLSAQCAKVMRLCDQDNELHIEDFGPSTSN